MRVEHKLLAQVHVSSEVAVHEPQPGVVDAESNGLPPARRASRHLFRLDLLLFNGVVHKHGGHVTKFQASTHCVGMQLSHVRVPVIGVRTLTHDVERVTVCTWK